MSGMTRYTVCESDLRQSEHQGVKTEKRPDCEIDIHTFSQPDGTMLTLHVNLEKQDDGEFVFKSLCWRHGADAVTILSETGHPGHSDIADVIAWEFLEDTDQLLEYLYGRHRKNEVPALDGVTDIQL